MIVQHIFKSICLREFIVCIWFVCFSSFEYINAQTTAVDGGWGEWYYTPCSKSCDDGTGPGIMERYRACNNPEPANGGSECQREDGSYTSPNDRLEKDASINSGAGYIVCAKSDCEGPEDTQAPDIPTNVKVEVLSYHEIKLTWDVTGDNTEVVKYRVYNHENVIVGVSQETYYTPPDYILEEYIFYHLKPSTQYTFTVTALDERGNESLHSEAVTATTQNYSKGDDLVNPYLDLEYLGAFRLPLYQSGDASKWEYGGSGLTYYPLGDASGPSDGHPGSLFGIGFHKFGASNEQGYISEVSIPKPVISATKSMSDLNFAEVIQPFAKVDTFDHSSLSEFTGSLAYHPKKGTQQTDKLYHVFGSKYNWTKIPTLSASELDLSNPQTQAWWYVGGSGDYDPPSYYNQIYALFSIPEDWADTYLGGKSLAIGGSSNSAGRGPELYAIAPWQDNAPDPLPPDRAELDYITLIDYSQTQNVNTLKEFQQTDIIHSGEWIDYQGKSAIIFSGTKGFGETIYSGGFVTTRMSPYLYFYNPHDLVDVIEGTKQPHEPQPYAMINLFDYFYGGYPKAVSTAVDNNNGYIYVLQYASEDGVINPVHVFKIDSATKNTCRLIVDKTGSGSGTVTGSGVECGSDCSEDYLNGTTITLTAIPDAGSIFSGWSGECSDAGECAIIMNSDANITAEFILETDVEGDPNDADNGSNSSGSCFITTVYECL